MQHSGLVSLGYIEYCSFKTGAAPPQVPRNAVQCKGRDKNPFIVIGPLQATYGMEGHHPAMLQGGAELGLRPRRRVGVQEGAGNTARR